MGIGSVSDYTPAQGRRNPAICNNFTFRCTESGYTAASRRTPTPLHNSGCGQPRYQRCFAPNCILKNQRCFLRYVASQRDIICCANCDICSFTACDMIWLLTLSRAAGTYRAAGISRPTDISRIRQDPYRCRACGATNCNLPQFFHTKKTAFLDFIL